MKDATVAHEELSKNSIIVFKAKRTNRKTISYSKNSNKLTKKRRERRLGQEKQHNMDDKPEHQRQKNPKFVCFLNLWLSYVFSRCMKKLGKIISSTPPVL